VSLPSMTPRVRRALLRLIGDQRESSSAARRIAWSACSSVSSVSVTLQVVLPVFGVSPSSIFVYLVFLSCLNGSSYSVECVPNFLVVGFLFLPLQLVGKDFDDGAAFLHGGYAFGAFD